MTPSIATQKMINSAANMHRIHKGIVRMSFEVLNDCLRVGDLKRAEEFRQICGQNFYKMKSYEIEILQLQKGL